MTARPKSNVLAMVGTQQQALSQARADSLLNGAASSQQIGEVGGWVLNFVDLGAGGNGLFRAAYAAAQVDVSGYAVQVLQGGSDRVAAVMDAGPAGSYGPVYPGWGVRMKRRFTRLRFRAWETAGAPGSAVFTLPGVWCPGRYLVVAVARVPDAEWLEPGAVGAGFMWSRDVSGQGYNVTTNVPTTGLGEGIRVRGAIAVQCVVRDTSGTITSGTIVWWKAPTSSGAVAEFGETDVQQPLVGGRQQCSLSEMEVKCSDGLYFPELRSYISSSGLPPNVYVHAFGTGGQISAPGGLL